MRGLTAKMVNAMVGVLVFYIVYSIMNGAGLPFLPTRDGYAWKRSHVPVSYARSLHAPSIAVTHTGDIIVGTDAYDRIFRSTDRGKTWRQSSTGIKRCWVNDVVVGQQGMIYAASGRGTYCSESDGKNWQLVHTVPKLGMVSLAVDDVGNVYAGTTEERTKEARLFQTTDGGKHWKSTDGGHIRGNIYSVAVDSESAIYAGTEEHGIYCINDGGRHWKNVWKPNPDDYSRVDSLAIAQDGKIWAAETNKLLYSTDSGKHWENANPGAKGMSYRTVAVSPEGEVLAGGYFGAIISRDGGKTWKPMGMRSRRFLLRTVPVITSFTFDKEGRVYAVGSRGDVFIGTPVSTSP